MPGNDEIARLAASFNGMAREIAEREEHISHLAYTDPLTGLPNRLQFQEKAASHLEAARARGARLALLCLDLDDFKSVNDTMGHSAGDTLLRVVAERIRRYSREHFVARLGGDEFAVLHDFEGPAAHGRGIRPAD